MPKEPLPTCNQVLIPARSKPIRYPGDIKENECFTPRSAQTAVQKLKKALKIKKAKVHSLQQRLYRSNKARISIKSVLESLKTKMLISDTAHAHIHQVFYLGILLNYLNNYFI